METAQRMFIIEAAMRKPSSKEATSLLKLAFMDRSHVEITLDLGMVTIKDTREEGLIGVCARSVYNGCMEWFEGPRSNEEACYIGSDR